MKILVLRTPGTPSVETDRFAAYLKRGFGIDCEFEFKDAKEPVLETGKGMGNSPFYYSKYGKGYDCLIITRNPKGEWTANAWLHPDGTYILEIAFSFADDFYRVVSHEIIHAFWRKVEAAGFPRVDTMDLYDKEMEPDAPNGNRARNIAALQPYRHLLDPQVARKSALQRTLDRLLALLASLKKTPLRAPSGLKGITDLFGSPGDGNQVLFDLPYPLFYNGVRVTRSRCHKLMVPVFQMVFQEIWDKGLSAHVQNYGGIYNYRPKRVNEQLSVHSWGIAVDIEPQKYPLGSKKRMPRAVVEVFKRHGFVCGEDFPKPDPGHFQFCRDY